MFCLSSLWVNLFSNVRTQYHISWHLVMLIIKYFWAKAQIATVAVRWMVVVVFYILSYIFIILLSLMTITVFKLNDPPILEGHIGKIVTQLGSPEMPCNFSTMPHDLQITRNAPELGFSPLEKWYSRFPPHSGHFNVSMSSLLPSSNISSTSYQSII